MLLEGRAKQTFDWFRKRSFELETEFKEKGGLPNHEVWRAQYYRNPYLLLETDQTILDRFADIFTNTIDISTDGKITPTPMMEQGMRLSRFFTEIIEETNWRAILHKDSMQPAFRQIHAYYENGEPAGVKMFNTLPLKQDNYLYKFSKREFVREMYDFGRFRICPASFYSKGSHIHAVKDFETIRQYRLKAIKEVSEGLRSIEYDGHQIDIVNGVVPVQCVLDDYYLFSTCNELSRRMPTDFEADAVLIIKNKKDFISRLKDELQISFPNWEFVEKNVYYYDSYNDIPKDPNQEFFKHIAYAYQKEHRSIIRPKLAKNESYELQPIYIEMGSLHDICEVIYA